MEKRKYYVVWEGFAPGIYDSWEECKVQIEGFEHAKYKSFSNKDQATRAFRANYEEHDGVLNNIAKALSRDQYKQSSDFLKESIAVKANFRQDSGMIEYRGVYVKNNQELFHIGPMDGGTLNIGEFLAVVHALALLKQNNSNLPIYTDNQNAILWVKRKDCNIAGGLSNKDKKVFELIERAEIWLKNNSFSNEIIKWKQKDWGEMPASFSN